MTVLISVHYQNLQELQFITIFGEKTRVSEMYYSCFNNFQ